MKKDIFIFNKGAYGIPKRGIRGFLDPIRDGVSWGWTYHALARARQKGVKVVPRSGGDIVEVEVDGCTRWAVKWVIRVRRWDRWDVYVIMRGADGFIVKTCWVNTLDDNHETLRKENYDRPEDF